MSFVICACSDETVEKLKTAKGLFDQFTGLKAAIDEQLPGGASGFTIHNSEILSVSLVNTLVEDATQADREHLADELVDVVGRYVRENELFPGLRTIVVTYSKYEKKFFVVDYTQQIARFQYELGKPDTVDASQRNGDHKG